LKKKHVKKKKKGGGKVGLAPKNSMSQNLFSSTKRGQKCLNSNPWNKNTCDQGRGKMAKNGFCNGKTVHNLEVVSLTNVLLGPWGIGPEKPEKLIARQNKEKGKRIEKEGVKGRRRSNMPYRSSI